VANLVSLPGRSCNHLCGDDVRRTGELVANSGPRKQLDSRLVPALVNDFVNRSFRDVADRDYIAGRILYRYDLGSQFLWAASQALEKYLKAILLYSRRSTKGLGHDIVRVLHQVRLIRAIHFEIPKSVQGFIHYLNEEGPNRYFEYPAYAVGDELLRFDHAIWHIRRYCYDMRGQIQTSGGEDS
jgi:HEPN domain-containing protein